MLIRHLEDLKIYVLNKHIYKIYGYICTRYKCNIENFKA
nr:MAG TPA: hypothetical protein [Caudoviricetes sp.]